MKNRMKLTVFCISILMIITTFASITIVGLGSGNRSNLPTLSKASVDPTSGDTTTWFMFEAIYTDLDGDQPTYVNVIIDNVYYNMSANGSNPVQGMLFVHSTQLSAGNHTYYFETMNSMREYARSPASGEYTLYVSPMLGNPPQLYNQYYSPTRPIANQTINFTICYKDLDNDAPTYIRLHIGLANINPIYSKYNMTIIGTSYSTGVVCYKTLILGEGGYNYSFSAVSGLTAAVPCAMRCSCCCNSEGLTISAMK